MLAVRKIESFAKDTGEPLTYHQPGALKIARLPEHEAQLEAEVARGRRLGVELDFVSPDEARRKMPFLETRGIRAVTFSPTDLYLEPAQIPVGYSRAAGKLGAAMLPHTRVTGITVKDGAVKGVSTDKGEISCRFVVDAAGAWTRLVASLASSTRSHGADAPPAPHHRADRRRRAEPADHAHHRCERLCAAGQWRAHAGRLREDPDPIRHGAACALLRHQGHEARSRGAARPRRERARAASRSLRGSDRASGFASIGAGCRR